MQNSLLTPRQITSPDDPDIAFFRFLKGNAQRIEESASILVEGEQQIERLLQTSLLLRVVFLEPRYYAKLGNLLNERISADTACFCAERAVMEQIVGYRLHRGALALAARPRCLDYHELPFPVVALNGLNDPENIGGIMRSCAAFSVPSLLADSGSSDPYHRRSIRVSMGAALFLNVSVVASLREALNELSARAATVAIEYVDSAQPLRSYSFPERSVLVFGNEKRGIEREVLIQCQHRVKIPMNQSFITSVNVAASAAIVLSELYNQRT